tara:strand:- start:264 stop:446 length:183 start_codon:yes stop_codon:yes gene_type:complete
MNEIRGRLSYQEIFFLHFGQFDLPKTIVLSFGNLAIQTFAKLPKINPIKKTVNISKINKG